MTAPPTIPRKDKYEQILSKYDWSSPHPPRGYQYGVGRGARGFSTSAELSAATGSIAAQMALTAGESELLDALSRIEDKRHKRRRAESTRPPASPDTPLVVVHARKKPKASLLSMDDIATVGAGVTASALIKRNARTEDLHVVDGYAFADETAVVTASDLLRSRAMGTSQSLENLLGMGSPTEQTTWITHSRALREMGMSRKAMQTLLEGCQVTGEKGPRIWLERLQHTGDPAAQRRLLEEAVHVCRGCEELWVRLLEYEPPHTRLQWLQQAVMACPASETLWLRVLAHVQAPREQRRVIRKALEVTPHLASLWARLARLESYETAKAIFNAATAEHPSLQIIVEAAKFEESHFRQQTGASLGAHTTNEETTESGGMDTSDVPKATYDACEIEKPLSNHIIENFITQAAERYLRMEESKSRLVWIEAAAATANDGYVITAAYLYLRLSAPRVRGAPLSASWLEDLRGLLQEGAKTHAVCSALWTALLIVHECGESRRALVDVELMSITLETAPPVALDATLAALHRLQPTAAIAPHGVNASPTPAMSKETPILAPETLDEKDTHDKKSDDAVHPTCLPSPLPILVLRTLRHAPTLFDVDTALRLARSLFTRKLHSGALAVLQFAMARHPHSATLVAAAAKSLAALGRDAEADECLVAGTAIPDADADVAWVKLAIHRRSMGHDVSALLDRATAAFPRSARLWLMRLESAATRAQAALRQADSAESNAAVVAEVRRLCAIALRPSHGGKAPAVWCFAAQRVESGVLGSAGAARARLVDGALACGPHLPAVQCAFGLSRCRIERTHAGRAPALEVAREVLHALPKRDGAVTPDAAELVALFIDLEAPAARGRAAAQALQHWHVRDALVLAAVARVYHAAGRYERALGESLKAARMREGRCGDAVALWLKLAALPNYRDARRAMMDAAESDETDAAPWPVGRLLDWLWAPWGGAAAVVPNSGPLWIEVAKARDPTNVTLLGYRDSVESMLQRVMDAIEL